MVKQFVVSSVCKFVINFINTRNKNRYFNFQTDREDSLYITEVQLTLLFII